MMLDKFLNQAKSILCLDGNLPDKNFFKNINIPIIAADGAANKLLELDINPAVIIGDLDSINSENFLNSKIIYNPDQNQNDFQKSLQYLKNNMLLPAIICGANGGYIDHILNNINIIIENECMFYDPPIIGYALNAPTKINLELELNTKLSLLGIENAKASTTGLKWELNNSVLTFPGSNSCYNRSISKNISIEVIDGKLLLLIYLTPMQDKGCL